MPGGGARDQNLGHLLIICDKVLVKVSLVVYISRTIYQKSFIFGLKVPYRVSFDSKSSDPRVHARGWG